MGCDTPPAIMRPALGDDYGCAEGARHTYSLQSRYQRAEGMAAQNPDQEGDEKD